MTKKNEAIDLDSLNTTTASNTGAEVELRHPITNAALGIFINVLGKDSDVFREHMRDTVNRRIRQEALATRRGKTVEPMTAEATEAEAVELLAICTIGWRSSDGDFILHKGEKLTFTQVNAARIYTDLLWVRRQIDEAIGDLEGFMKN